MGTFDFYSITNIKTRVIYKFVSRKYTYKKQFYKTMLVYIIVIK